MTIAKGANLALRFTLEISALVIAAYWGWQTGDGAVRWLLAVAAPLAFAFAWWLFVAPKAAVTIPRAARLAVELVLFGAVALALAATGHGALALAFALVALASGTLNYRWG